MILGLCPWITPVMNDLEVWETIQKFISQKEGKIFVYLLSEDDQPKNIPEGLNGWIQKPLDFEKFKTILTKLDAESNKNIV